MIRMLTAALCLVLCTLPPAGACTDVAMDMPELAYDPNAPAPSRADFEVRLIDSCAPGTLDGNRQVRLWFVDDIEPAPHREIGGIAFEILDRSKRVLYAPGETISRRAIETYRSPGDGRIALSLAAMAGQTGRGGVLSLSLCWEYDTASERGRVDCRPVSIAMAVSRSVSLGVLGGGQDWTLAFGTLEPGEVLGVEIEAHAAGPFEITLASDYGGRMRRAEPCGAVLGPAGPDETVEYEARIDGRTVALDRPFRVGVAPPDGRAVIGFTAQIDPALIAARKRAGSYCDILTLTIVPRP